MAKLKGPLFSLEASGQLGKFAVYFPWKGLKVVRVHVVPTNPRSAAQTIQRGYVTAANAVWHATGWTVADLAAWNKAASTDARVMTGPNKFSSEYLIVAVALGTWADLWDGRDAAAAGTDRELRVKGVAGLLQTRVRWGLRATAMINTIVMIWDAPNTDWLGQIAPGVLTSGQTVYYQFYEGATFPVRIGVTGIYSFVMP